MLGGSCLGIAYARRFIRIAVSQTTFIENLASGLVLFECRCALVLFFIYCFFCNYCLSKTLSVNGHRHTKHEGIIVIFAFTILIGKYQILAVRSVTSAITL